MKIRATIGIVLSLTVFVLIFGLMCWPMVCGIRLMSWLVRHPEPIIRSRVARCAHGWGSRVFSLVTRFLHLDVTLIVDGERDLLRDHACVIIANHQSTLDIAVITWLIQQLGQANARWILKRMLWKLPVIGWIAQRTGCAFVSRQKDPKDLDEIRRCGNVLREDQASIVLFPEGTRFTNAQAREGFQHVLPPKKAGFHLLREALPNAPVVTVTLQWSPPVADGLRGRTILQAADFYGKSLRIVVRIVPAAEVRADPDWLEHDWRAKDHLLASYASHEA